MRIGINLLYLIPGVVGGTETYARGLLSGLHQLQSDHEFVLFLNRESSELACDLGSKFEAVVCPVNAVRKENRYFFEQVKLRRYLKDHRIDLLHSLGYTSPRFVHCPTVASVHDLNFKAFGDSMSFSRRAVLGYFVRQSLIHSDRIITISEFSRGEIQREYGIPREKIVVTYLAAALEELERAPDKTAGDLTGSVGTGRPYAVAFSSTYANKNIPFLLKAFKEARKNNKLDHRLVLVGHRFPSGNGETEAGSDPEIDGIIWTGYLDRHSLFRVLRGADFLVFPSFYEGFGMPVLESMAVGVPVLCSNAASLPEVGGDAVVFFDPFSIKDLSEKFVRMASDAPLREMLRQRGIENLKRFSWKKTAAETVAVYEEVWRGGKS